LVHWRRQTRSLHLIAIALWVEGFPIELDPVRAMLFAITSQTERELVAEEDLSVFIEQQTRKLAGAHGKHAPPRIVRMTSDASLRLFARRVPRRSCSTSLRSASSSSEQP
jgi:hypothetical protein